MGITSGAKTAYPSGAPGITPRFMRGSCASIFFLCCRSLFNLLSYIFFGPQLYCLSLFTWYIKQYRWYAVKMAAILSYWSLRKYHFACITPSFCTISLQIISSISCQEEFEDTKGAIRNRIEEEQTTQWPKEKVQKDKQWNIWIVNTPRW